MSRELIEAMMDLSFSMATLGARQLGAAVGGAAARQAMGAVLRCMQQSAEVARAALPGEVGLEWRELANKLEAFELFQQAPARLGLVAASQPPWQELLRRASALGAYRAIWTLEGLGYACIESAWAAMGPPPRGLLSHLVLEGGSAGTVIPLHTGAGLAFAGRLLDSGEIPSSAELTGWLARWEDSAEPGYGAIAAEALGLVARNLYPHLVPRLGERLGRVEPLLSEYFWHGVGRGLYFAPTHALPHSGAHGRAFDKTWREPPDEAGRCNATAGLAWALTLVNIRDPEVLADVLRRRSGEIGSAGSFANGVASAVLIWYDAVGLDSHLSAFLAYRPQESVPALTLLWRDLVLAPCEEALQHTYPRLRRSGRLATLFRCQPPPREGVVSS
jgi:hypothetical protein